MDGKQEEVHMSGDPRQIKQQINQQVSGQLSDMDGMNVIFELQHQIYHQTLGQINDRAWKQIWREVCRPVYGIVCQQAIYPCITKAARDFQ